MDSEEKRRTLQVVIEKEKVQYWMSKGLAVSHTPCA